MNNVNICLHVGEELKKSVDMLPLQRKKELYKEIKDFIRSYIDNQDFVNLSGKELQELEEKIAELRKKLN